MKRVLSIFILTAVLLTGINITDAVAEGDFISGSAEAGRYTWLFFDDSGKNTYDYTDEYASIRIGTGNNDSISPDTGIYWNGPGCTEPTDATNSAAVSNRYVLIKPVFSGTVTLKIYFPSATASGKGRVGRKDFGDVSFDEVDLTTLVKLSQTGDSANISGEITTSAVNTLTFEVTAGHTYSLHTYNKSSYISEMYYESASIIGKTEKPAIIAPVIEGDTQVKGACINGSEVKVRINGGEVHNAAVSGTEWTVGGLSLNAGDEISVTAKAGEYKESDAVSVKVIALNDVCALTINQPAHGTITTNQNDNSRILKGTKVTVVVTPDSGYKITSLTAGGNKLELNDINKYIIEVNDDIEISAETAEKAVNDIKIFQSDHGTVTAERDTYEEGAQVKLSVTPEDGYRIKSLSYAAAGGQKEIKYGNSFIMPAEAVTVKAEFKREAVISAVDTSLTDYDRLTLTVGGKPFFYNGIQVRPDNALNQLKFNYDQIRNMYLQAGEDGYTVVNSQITWLDIQPDKAISSDETGYLENGSKNVSDNDIIARDYGGDTSERVAYITFNDLPAIEADKEYAAVKLRLYAKSQADTAYTVYGVIDGRIDESFSVTSPSWDVPGTLANYHSVNVADFVNEHKNEGSVTFAVVSENDITISGSGDVRSPQLKLSRDDVYDFTHLDKILDFASEAGVKFEVLWFATDTCQQTHESRVPYYVHANYQKCLKTDGTPAKVLAADNNFIMCKNDMTLRAKEKEALETMFDYIAEYDAAHGNKHLVIGCQVANETAVGRLHSGTNEDKYFDRCHCDMCEKIYAEKLKRARSEAAALYDFKQETLWGYLNNLGSAVKESDYSVWTRHNNYMTTDTNVLALNEQKRETTGTDIDFIGLDPYSVDSGADHDYIYSFGHESCTYKGHSFDYSQGKNLPLVMEYGGNNADLAESVLACIAGGGFFNVYELLSGKENFGTYIADRDAAGNAVGTFTARGSFIEQVRGVNKMLQKVQYDLASKKADGAGGNRLLFFNPKSEVSVKTVSKQIGEKNITYNTENNGVGIAIDKGDNEIALLSSSASEFVIDGMDGDVSVQSGCYSADTDKWIWEKDKAYTVEAGNIKIKTDAYECVRLSLNGAEKEIAQLTDISADENGNLSASLIYNGEGALEKAAVIWASYDGGVIKNIKVFNVTGEGHIDFYGCMADSDTELKLFVWNTLDGMEPMSRVYTVKDIYFKNEGGSL